MTNDPDARDPVYLTDVLVIPSVGEGEESELVGRWLEEWWKQPGKTGALAGAQAISECSQEVEEEAAHSGRL